MFFRSRQISIGKMNRLLGVLTLAGFILLTKAQLRTFCNRPYFVQNAVYTPQPTGTLQRYNRGDRITITCNNGYENLGESVLECIGTYWRSIRNPRSGPRCVRINNPMMGGMGPVATVGPVLPAPDVGVAVYCAVNACADNSRCVTYGGTNYCACNAGYFRHQTDGCVARSLLTDATPAQCATQQPCPANSACAVYKLPACICNPGYFVSFSLRRCIAMPTFIPSVPVEPTVCQRPTGDNLVTLPAGKAVWAVGESIAFGCPGDYSLDGQRLSACASNGQFSTAIPICRRNIAPVQCTGPLTPANGISLPVGTTAWNVGASVGFQCNNGYRLSGSSTATCTASGTFTAHNPSCTLIQVVVRATCPSPVAPLNGRVNEARQVWREGDRVTYSCNAGFPLSGSSSAVCQNNGEYSNAPPFCGTPQRCSVPVAIAGGTMVIAGGTVTPANMRELNPGETVQYSCATGLRIFGESQLRCQSNGRYNHPFPYCIGAEPSPVAATCSNPGAPANGFVASNQGTYVVRQAVQIVCVSGYEIVGQTPPVCQADGSFSSGNVQCIATQPPVGVTCSNPTSPQNGFVTNNRGSYVVGEDVQVSCNSGYQLVGQVPVVCQNNGLFSSGNVQCAQIVTNPPIISVTCSNPAAPANGFVVNLQSSYTVGEAVQLGCVTGYQLVGPTPPVCQSSGFFSTGTQSCQLLPPPNPNTCTNPTVPANGRIEPVDKTEWQEGELIVVVCFENFSLANAGTRLCQSGGVIFGETPQCEPEEPTEPPLPTCTPTPPINGHFVPKDVTQFEVGVPFSVACDEGYVRKGLGLNVCLLDGTVAVEVATCEATVAPVAADSTCTPQSPVNGYIEPRAQTEYNVGTSFTYACEDGHILVGTPVNSCRSTAGNEVLPIPLCVASIN